jgi:hypothetical protein
LIYLKKIRAARRADLAQVIAIDAGITGLRKPAYWSGILARYGTRQRQRYFLVAETDRAVQGYIVGEVRDWEFGSPPCGWVFGLGVRPEARLAGVGARLSAGRLQADISVENLSGHKFPTAYPSRRAWLHVTVKDREGRVVFESGALNRNGSIQGNDNDADPKRFETHYIEVTNTDQVQIYEDIMVDVNNVPTTGLLTAVRFIKDNRLLPAGFNKNAVEQEIAPQGEATGDADFTGGGDKIRYSVAVGNAQGPFQVQAELWFQPISYRWAENLRSYEAMEPQRFTRYYDSMASGSGLMLNRASATR